MQQKQQNEDIRPFEMHVLARKLKLFISNYLAIVDYYKGKLQVHIDKRAIKCLEKYSTSCGQFDGIHHLAFYDEDNNLRLGIQYNQEGQILKTEYINEEGNIQEVQVNPTKVAYTVNVLFGSKRSKNN